MNFSDKDISQIKEHGLTTEEIDKQIQKFNTGFPFIEITNHASVGNGVICCSDKDYETYTKIYEEYAQNHNIVKFVPASGAATRMFKDLFDFLSNNTWITFPFGPCISPVCVIVILSGSLLTRKITMA